MVYYGGFSRSASFGLGKFSSSSSYSSSSYDDDDDDNDDEHDEVDDDGDKNFKKKIQTSKKSKFGQSDDHIT